MDEHAIVRALTAEQVIRSLLSEEEHTRWRAGEPVAAMARYLATAAQHAADIVRADIAQQRAELRAAERSLAKCREGGHTTHAIYPLLGGGWAIRPLSEKASEDDRKEFEAAAGWRLNPYGELWCDRCFGAKYRGEQVGWRELAVWDVRSEKEGS